MKCQRSVEEGGGKGRMGANTGWTMSGSLSVKRLLTLLTAKVACQSAHISHVEPYVRFGGFAVPLFF